MFDLGILRPLQVGEGVAADTKEMPKETGVPRMKVFLVGVLCYVSKAFEKVMGKRKNGFPGIPSCGIY